MVKNCLNILKNVALFRHPNGKSPQKILLTFIYYYVIINLKDN